MKTFTVGEAQGKLAQLIAEAHLGESIVLTDGERKVMLEPRLPIDPEIDSPELEAELLKAASGPFTPYSPVESGVHGTCRNDSSSSCQPAFFTHSGGFFAAVANPWAVCRRKF